jgi:hypothetical protein
VKSHVTTYRAGAAVPPGALFVCRKYVGRAGTSRIFNELRAHKTISISAAARYCGANVSRGKERNKANDPGENNESDGQIARLPCLARGDHTCLADGSEVIPKYAVFRDASGLLATVNLAGPTDTATNPFFQSLGTNGHSCVSCHQPTTQWTITATWR